MLITSVENSYWPGLDNFLPLKSVQDTPGKGRAFSLTIRYVEAFSPESEIAIALDLDSPPVVEYSVLSKRLGGVMEQLLGRQKEIALADLNGAVKVNRKRIGTTPRRLMAWHEGFLGSLGKALPEMSSETNTVYTAKTFQLVPDAEIIEFWYEEGQTQLKGRFTPPTGSAWIKWATALREEVIHRAPASKP
jgi:hypothetical protein